MVKIKGIDDFLILQDDPDTALQGLEDKAVSIIDFLNPDHRTEIVRAISLINDGIERELIVKNYAKKLQISPEVIRAVIGKNEKDTNEESVIEDIEPWDCPVDGNELLSELVKIFNTHVVLPHHGDLVSALYVLFTYCIDVVVIAPILGIRSPEKRCGKSTLLNIFLCLCYRALVSSNISPSAIFRSIEKWSPTLIVDELDTFLPQNEELRGVLNSGHAKHLAFVIRSDGKEFEPRRFLTFCPKILALIGQFPPTLTDRSIILEMSRKRVDEKVTKIGVNGTLKFLDIRRKCLRWAQDNKEKIKTSTIETPVGLHDREADNWHPLLTIAKVIGTQWFEKARNAVQSFCGNGDDGVNIQLLVDIYEYFEKEGDDKITSTELVEHLGKMEDRPWIEWKKGKQITPRQVATLLRPFNIQPKLIRIGDTIARGYDKEWFSDVFSRYLPFQSVTPLQPNNGAGLRDFSSVTRKNDVTDKNNSKSSKDASCNAVTDKKGSEEEILEVEGQVLGWS